MFSLKSPFNGWLERIFDLYKRHCFWMNDSVAAEQDIYWNLNIKHDPHNFSNDLNFVQCLNQAYNKESTQSVKVKQMTAQYLYKCVQNIWIEWKVIIEVPKIFPKINERKKSLHFLHFSFWIILRNVLVGVVIYRQWNERSLFQFSLLLLCLKWRKICDSRI